MAAVVAEQNIALIVSPFPAPLTYYARRAAAWAVQHLASLLAQILGENHWFP